jgi:hypothetical protein
MWFSSLVSSDTRTPSITLRVYAHLFDSEAQADRAREGLEARFGGNTVVTRDRKRRENTGTPESENGSTMRVVRPAELP